MTTEPRNTTRNCRHHAFQSDHKTRRMLHHPRRSPFADRGFRQQNQSTRCQSYSAAAHQAHSLRPSESCWQHLHLPTLHSTSQSHSSHHPHYHSPPTLNTPHPTLASTFPPLLHRRSSLEERAALGSLLLLLLQLVLLLPSRHAVEELEHVVGRAEVGSDHPLRRHTKEGTVDKHTTNKSKRHGTERADR